ncbi:MAG TPA: hypothetical protein VG056_02165, partial [Pirellulales bacterium]|nr:hypothetical protein [Pirellulales bacterium]
MHELVALPAIYRKTAALAIGTLLALGTARLAHAQEGVPQPPPLGAYFWVGPPDGSGNGDAGDWNNWNGRYVIHAGSPPTIEHLPPQDGDALIIDHGFNHENLPHTISLGDLNLPSSGIQFSYYATFTGGSLNVNSVGIRSMNNIVGATFPVTFVGTSFDVNGLTANTDNDTMTFSAVDITAGEMQLGGSYSLDPVNFPPPGGTPIINLEGATVNASTITIANNSTPGSGRFVTNVTDSQIQSLGMEIGFGGNTLNDAAEVNLNHSEATIDQYLLIGSQGGGRLRLNDQSTVTLSGANSYVNVGQQGEGDLLVTQMSTLTSNLLNIGVAERGTMTVDQGGRVFSQSGVLGVLAGMEGNVTLSDDALWQTNDLTVGENGTGYVYIYDQATLHIDGQGILGNAPGSRGVLNLIGPDTKLELGPSGTLTIGEEGDGELNLSQGATFTSRGDVNLGAIEGSSGMVTVDGQDGPSTWTVSG